MIHLQKSEIQSKFPSEAINLLGRRAIDLVQRVAAVRMDVQCAMYLRGGVLAGFAVVRSPEHLQHGHAALGPRPILAQNCTHGKTLLIPTRDGRPSVGMVPHSE